MTKYWGLGAQKVRHIPILYLNVYVVDFFVTDRHTGKNIFRLRDVFVDESWLTALNVVSGRKSARSGTEYTSGSGYGFRFPDYKILKILDSKELPDL